MDASYKIQRGIHVHLIQFFMCPEFWVHIRAVMPSKRRLFFIWNVTKNIFDMYPLYWTPSRGGIIMRYTYEYKRKCVELYREGKWPETPEGVSDKSFRDKVRLWV